jgi:hypothetical protein
MYSIIIIIISLSSLSLSPHSHSHSHSHSRSRSLQQLMHMRSSGDANTHTCRCICSASATHMQSRTTSRAAMSLRITPSELPGWRGSLHEMRHAYAPCRKLPRPASPTAIGASSHNRWGTRVLCMPIAPGHHALALPLIHLSISFTAAPRYATASPCRCTGR